MKEDMEKVFESKVSKKVQRLEDIKSEVSRFLAYDLKL